MDFSICALALTVSLPLPDCFGLAVIVPDFILPTVRARQVIPDSYSAADAVYNVQRAALLIAALATGTASAFRFHQPYRQELVPGLAEILHLRAPGLLGCALSGAGPSVLVFFERGNEEVCDLVRQIFAFHGRQSDMLPARIAETGYELCEEPDLAAGSSASEEEETIEE